MTARTVEAQLAPMGTYYAGRSSDTGFTGPNASGGYSATVPLDLPPARGGLPVPLQTVSGPARYGAAGVGWDIPLSYVYIDTSFVHRRPSNKPDQAATSRKRITLSLFGRRGRGFLKRSLTNQTLATSTFAGFHDQET